MKPKNLNSGEEQAIEKAREVGLSDVPCVSALIDCIERLDDEIERLRKVEDLSEGIRAAGNALARHVAQDNRGQTARALVRAWEEAAR